MLVVDVRPWQADDMSESTTTKATVPNRYDADCNACGGRVLAGTGIIAGRMVGGSRRWLVRHTDAACTPPTNRPVRPEDWPCMVHGPGDDECLGDRCLTAERMARRPAANVCRRHGNTYDAQFASANGCWECHMERAIAARDEDERVAVANYKMNRDAR